MTSKVAMPDLGSFAPGLRQTVANTFPISKRIYAVDWSRNGQWELTPIFCRDQIIQQHGQERKLDPVSCHGYSKNPIFERSWIHDDGNAEFAVYPEFRGYRACLAVLREPHQSTRFAFSSVGDAVNWSEWINSKKDWFKLGSDETEESREGNPLRWTCPPKEFLLYSGRVYECEKVSYVGPYQVMRQEQRRYAKMLKMSYENYGEASFPRDEKEWNEMRYSGSAKTFADQLSLPDRLRGAERMIAGYFLESLCLYCRNNPGDPNHPTLSEFASMLLQTEELLHLFPNVVYETLRPLYQEMTGGLANGKGIYVLR